MLEDFVALRRATGQIQKWLWCLILSGTRLTIIRARIPPESGNMSDMLSPAISDPETCADNSEAESRGRNRLGCDWLECLESVLFDKVSDI